LVAYVNNIKSIPLLNFLFWNFREVIFFKNFFGNFENFGPTDRLNEGVFDMSDMGGGCLSRPKIMQANFHTSGNLQSAG